jgi:hypothetical protein
MHNEGPGRVKGERHISVCPVAGRPEEYDHALSAENDYSK